IFSYYYLFYFFFSSRRRHTRSKRDWSSDVCSSDLAFRHISLLPGSRRALCPPKNGPRARTGRAHARARQPFSHNREKSCPARSEIGRASCRERGEVEVGAVSGNGDKTEEDARKGRD